MTHKETQLSLSLCLSLPFSPSCTPTHWEQQTACIYTHTQSSLFLIWIFFEVPSKDLVWLNFPPSRFLDPQIRWLIIWPMRSNSSNSFSFNLDNCLEFVIPLFILKLFFPVYFPSIAICWRYPTHTKILKYIPCQWCENFLKNSEQWLWPFRTNGVCSIANIFKIATVHLNIPGYFLTPIHNSLLSSIHFVSMIPTNITYFMSPKKKTY